MHERQSQQATAKKLKVLITNSSGNRYPQAETFKEGSLFKQVGNYSIQLDACAPNLYSHKFMLQNSINQARFPNKSHLSPPQLMNPESPVKIESKLAPRRSGLNIQMKILEDTESKNKTLSHSHVFGRASHNQSAHGGSSPRGASQKMNEQQRLNEALQNASINSKSKRTYSMEGFSLNYSFRAGEGVPTGLNTTTFTLRKEAIIRSKYKTKKIFESSMDNKSQLSNLSRINERKNSEQGSQKQTQPSQYTNVSQLLKTNKEHYAQLFQNTQESRQQYLRNKDIRPTQLISPVDSYDFPNGKVIDYSQAQPSQTLKLMKNSQTSPFVEPTKTKRFTEFSDLINCTLKLRPESNNNGRTRFITEFQESQHKPHFSPEYRSKIDKFPNLFSKQKTEFGKITNSLPATSLIIKSNFNFKR